MLVGMEIENVVISGFNHKLFYLWLKKFLMHPFIYSGKLGATITFDNAFMQKITFDSAFMQKIRIAII